MTPELVAVGEGSIGEGTLLGHITFWSLPDDAVAADELLRVWLDAGLDESALPETRQPAHVFQSACASVKKRVGNGNGRVEIRADEVENSPTRCSYQITRVIWNRDDRTVEHEKSLRLEFDKATHRISAERLDHFDPALADLEDQVRRHYKEHVERIPGAKIRNAVRAVVLDLGGQNLRRKSGSLYFVPCSEIPGRSPSKPTLDGLSKVAEELYGERGDVHTLPCGNGAYERAMLRKHIVLNAKETAQKLTQRAVARVNEAGTDRAPRQDFLSNLYKERKALVHTVGRFKYLVGIEESDVAQPIRELDAALAELQGMAQ